MEPNKEQVAEALIVHDLRRANTDAGNALIYAMDLKDPEIIEKVGAAISAIDAARKAVGDRKRIALS